MSDNVVIMPTAATSYITVRKNRANWDVVLATPAGSNTLHTLFYSISDKATAYEMGRKTAARMQRPFKTKGVVGDA